MKHTTTDWTPLRKMAEQRRDKRALQLAAIARRRIEAQRKLDQLRNYRLEYLPRMRQAGLAGTRGESLRNYREFLAKLDLAIEQQAEIVMRIEREQSDAQQFWRDEQRSVHSYEVLAERAAHAARSLDRRTAQKQQDELAGRSRPQLVRLSDS